MKQYSRGSSGTRKLTSIPHSSPPLNVVFEIPASIRQGKKVKSTRYGKEKTMFSLSADTISYIENSRDSHFKRLYRQKYLHEQRTSLQAKNQYTKKSLTFFYSRGHKMDFLVFEKN